MLPFTPAPDRIHIGIRMVIITLGLLSFWSGSADRSIAAVDD
jgi:hypothetical protein